MFTSIATRTVAWIVQHAWTVLVLAALVVAALTAGTASLTFRSDDRVFFSEANPELLALESFEAMYGREDSIVFVLTATDGDLFTPARLAAINALTDQAWHMPHVRRVDSVTNFQRVHAEGNGDDDEVVIDHLARSGDSLTVAQARALKEVAVNETLLVGRLLTTDARVGLVAVQFRLTDDLPGDIAGELMAVAREMAATLSANEQDIDVRVTGSLALDNAFGEASTLDGMLLTPIMLGLIFGLIGLIFRSVTVLVGALLVITAAIGCAMGIAGWLLIPLSSPSVSAPFIILTLATADCIHLAAAVFRAARTHPERDRKAAVCHGFLGTVRPITLTSITTAIGFFSLMFSESPPFAHLGFISGVGVIFAWLLSLTLLPALLTILPWRAGKDALLLPESGWRALHRFIERRPAAIVATLLTLGVVGAGLAFTNVLDDRYVEYFDERFEFRQATDYLNEEIGGFYTLEFSLDAGEPDGISQMQYLRHIDGLAGWLREQPEVTHVAALSDIMRTVNRGMNGGQADAYALPQGSSRAAQYLMLYEMSLPVGLDLREQVTADKSASRMTVGLQNLSTQEVLALVERAGAWMRQHAPRLADATSATGTTVLFSHIGQRNIEQMLVGTFLALTAISLILFVAFGSIVLGATGVATNLLPPLASLGGWALIVGEVGMAVATIAAVTLGIVVDDTIHFIEAAQRARRRGLDASQAVLHAMLKAGPGILSTTVVLAMGFACLAFSGFQINAWMGLMTAIVICVAFVFDMLFLPSTLIFLRNWK